MKPNSATIDVIRIGLRRSREPLEIASSVFAPRGKATLGEVGVTIRSTFSNAALKSSAIFVRTFWARP